MKKLNDDELKKVDGGSTIITIRSQTFGKPYKEGGNTIKMNFRKVGKNSKKKK